MKNSTIKKACARLSVVLGASTVCGAAYQERDEINRSFTLATKARVEVAAISGSVDIKAIDGDMAIVQIERTAPSRPEFDCNNVVLDHMSGNLSVQIKPVGGPSCQITQVVYRVLLSVPRHVDVSIHGVSGPIHVGEIEGALSIRGNSGNINLEQSGRGSIISGNSGTININLQRVDARELEVSGNSGAIKLYIGDESNVDVKVTGLSGSVSSDLPNVQFTKTGPARYYARIGSSGPTINVDASSGSVLLSRYRE